MRPIIPWTCCSCSGDGWISWNPTSWTHSTSLQFSVFPAYVLLCWHSLHGSFCTRATASAVPGVEHRPPEWSTHCVGLCRDCVGCVGDRELPPAGRAELHLLCLAGGRLCLFGWRCSTNSPFTPSMPPSGKLWRDSVPGHGAPTSAAAKAGHSVSYRTL